MTDTFARDDMFGPFGDMLNRAGRFLGRIGFGVVVMIAVGVALLATTFIGLLLAFAALFLTLARGQKRAPANRAETRESEVLDAQRTADGWVIEQGRASWR